MRNDPGSNYNLMEVYAAAAIAASTVVSSVVNHGTKGAGASFLLSLGTFATSCVMTLQHSASPTTDFTDEVTGMGNDVSATLATTGSAQIDVPNPREQYSRVKIVAGGALVGSVMAVAGPITQIIPPIGVEES